MASPAHYFEGKIYPDTRDLPLGVNRGLSFGDGLFETIRVEADDLPRLALHESRMLGGMALLNIEAPQPHWPSVLPQLHEAAGQPPYSRLKWMVFRGGMGGYLPETSQGHTLLSLMPRQDTYNSMPAVSLSTQTGIIPPIIDAKLGKTLSCLHYVVAAQRARQRGADHALLVSADGWVLETEHANVMFWHNEALHLCKGGISGTQQAYLQAACEAAHIPTKVVAATVENLLCAESLWITNSLIGSCPVASIDGIPCRHSPEMHQVVMDLL